MLPIGRSGIRNVAYHEGTNKWMVRFTKDKKRIWVGEFDDLYDAAKALAKAQTKHGISLKDSDAVEFMKKQDQKKAKKIKKVKTPKKNVQAKPAEHSESKLWKSIKNARISLNIYIR